MRYSEILVENRDFFIPALAFDAPICVSLLEHCHTGWSGKTRMVWLPGGEKKFDDRFPINGGVECRWGMKKSRFSTNILETKQNWVIVMVERQ